MIFGICRSTIDPPPSLAAWQAWRALGGTHVRLTAALHLLCKAGPDPATWDWPALDAFVDPILKAGLRIYLNPGGAPAWASEGQPLFVGEIPGTSWWNDPDHPDVMQIHFFDQDATRNPKYAAIDQLQPPRPYLTAAGTPHIDNAFMRSVGYELATRYRNRADCWGIWNEPGGDVYYPPIRWDDQNYGGLGDVIADRYMPEIAYPFMDGVRLGYWPDGDISRMRTVAADADGDGVLDRILEAESLLGEGPAAPPMLYNYALGVHPYGDINGMGYATTPAFQAVAKKWSFRKRYDNKTYELKDREMWCTEIDGAPQALLDWFKTQAKNYSAVFFGNANRFMPGWPNDLVVSPVGKEMAATFAAINGGGRHRAVLHP